MHSRLGPGGRHQVRQRLERLVRTHAQHLLVGAYHADGGEIPVGIVGQRVVKCGAMAKVLLVPSSSV